MTIADLLLPEVDQEMAITRRVLERVPDDRLGWKPHDRSWSMGDLASHIVNMIKWTDVTMIPVPSIYGPSADEGM